MCRLEKDEKGESVQALRNLVLLVGSLTTCGFTELKPTTSNSDSLFQIPGFVIPQPMGKGRDTFYYFANDAIRVCKGVFASIISLNEYLFLHHTTRYL